MPRYAPPEFKLLGEMAPVAGELEGPPFFSLPVSLGRGVSAGSE